MSAVAEAFVAYCWWRDNAPRFSKTNPDLEALRERAIKAGVLDPMMWGVVSVKGKDYSLKDNLVTWLEQETRLSATEKKWLSDFKAEFQRRTGITWTESGRTDDDAFTYYPEDIGESVQHQMDKYGLLDINGDGK